MKKLYFRKSFAWKISNRIILESFFCGSLFAVDVDGSDAAYAGNNDIFKRFQIIMIYG